MLDQELKPIRPFREDEGQQAVEPQFYGYRVCYADTDAGGIVYHGRYIEMSERSRNSLMNRVGFNFVRLADEHQIMMVIQRVECVYFAPALLDDFLTLRSRLTKCRSAYSVWVTDVMRGEDRIAAVTAKIVFLDTESRKVARHPQALVDGLSHFLEE